MGTYTVRVLPFCLKVRCHPGLRQPGRWTEQREPSKKGSVWAMRARAAARRVVCRLVTMGVVFTNEV